MVKFKPDGDLAKKALRINTADFAQKSAIGLLLAFAGLCCPLGADLPFSSTAFKIICDIDCF